MSRYLDVALENKAEWRARIERDTRTFTPGVLVLPGDSTAHDFWGRSQYPRRRVHYSGECPVFKPGNRWDYIGR